MKKVEKTRIVNIEGTDIFDNTLSFSYLETNYQNSQREVYFMWDLLKQRENTQLLNEMWDKYGMYANVYSEKDEIEIFKNLFEMALKENKKIHIVWVTLDEEIKMLEEYYETLGFMREDINCFKVDFSVPLVTVSVHIENLIWRGSDYKRMWKKIFFLPPIREAGLTKSMFKGINRWVIAGIHIKNLNDEVKEFFQKCVIEEHILPLTLGKVLQYHMLDAWFEWTEKQIILDIFTWEVVG
jgi:hypothetical protein